MPDVRKCLTCNGEKQVRIPGTNKFEKCPACKGKGYVVVETI